MKLMKILQKKSNLMSQYLMLMKKSALKLPKMKPLIHNNKKYKSRLQLATMILKPLSQQKILILKWLLLKVTQLQLLNQNKRWKKQR